jgi:GNAT superfamily N-acetyltransferase
MEIRISEVKSKKDYKTFIYLPEKIHKGDKFWLPPIYLDEKKFFKPETNLSFRDCEYTIALAFKDGVPVGRIMGIIHKKHNEIFNLKNARFGYMECYNDAEVFHALIQYIENWAREKGMNKVIGPYGFTDRDIQGFQIKGFEYEPVVDAACNPPYMPEFLEKEGYAKELDCVIHRFPLTTQLPEVYTKIYERIISRKDYVFHNFTKRSQFKDFIVPVFRMLNESFTDIYGFMPMDELEMVEMAKKYIPILDPRFVKIVTKDNKVVAFMVAMPNMYKGIQKSKGRLFPFGLFYILKAIKTAEAANTMLGAVSPEYQKHGLDAFLGLATIQAAKDAGMKYLDTHVVMEDNKDMMAETQRYGSYEIKRFRVFQKSL